MAEIGSATQDFELIDINKTKTTLSSMKGSVVFINFWATWCESCIDEMPSIERMSRHFAGNPAFKIVTILYKDDLDGAELHAAGRLTLPYPEPDYLPRRCSHHGHSETSYERKGPSIR
jgi:thiol-disulfide isomerase/thioredoxin